MADLAAALADSVVTNAPFVADVGSVDLAGAFDLQDRVGALIAPRLGGRAGWKIAWNVPHLMEKFGMPHPGMGRVFASQIYASGSKIPLVGTLSPMLEAEIVAKLGADIGPGQHTHESIASAIEGFTVGFEVLDRRAAPSDATTEAILAQNVFNAGAVVGHTWVKPQDLETEGLHTFMTFGKETVVDGHSLTPQDPVEAVRFIAEHFTARGERLRKGEIVLCGSHIPLYPVKGPGQAALAMGPLGIVTLDYI